MWGETIKDMSNKPKPPPPPLDSHAYVQASLAFGGSLHCAGGAGTSGEGWGNTKATRRAFSQTVGGFGVCTQGEARLIAQHKPASRVFEQTAAEPKIGGHCCAWTHASAYRANTIIFGITITIASIPCRCLPPACTCNAEMGQKRRCSGTCVQRIGV